MDTRIGYPNEHLAGDSDAETTSPLYATAVGLVMNSLENKARSNAIGKEVEDAPIFTVDNEDDASLEEMVSNETDVAEKIKQPRERKGIFDKWAEKFKEFLDNAE